jgi:hypothetical protein
MLQMLFKVTDEFTVQIGPAQINNNWRNMSALGNLKEMGENQTFANLRRLRGI